MKQPLSRRDFGVTMSRLTVSAAMLNSVVLHTAPAHAASPVWASAQAGAPEPALKTPRLGAHTLPFDIYGDGTSGAPLSTPAMATQAQGSLMLVSVGRGNFDGFTGGRPTDNKGNLYARVGQRHPYTLWPDSGTALYASEQMAGGPGHMVSTRRTDLDEVTMAAVEVIGGSSVIDAQWNEVLLDSGLPVTSLPVTTTGPAMLIAFWWGDGGVGFNSAIPNKGFQVIDAVIGTDSIAVVQCTVAAKRVNKAGTYDVTWMPTPAQGAQLWLVAVQPTSTD